MKKILNKKTYGYLGLFVVLCYFFYSQNSHLITELFAVEDNIKNISTDIKIAEKKINLAEVKINEIKAKNAQNIKEKVDIEAVRKKIKKQLKAYNLINETVKVNFNSLNEQNKYLDAFVAEFDLVTANASTLEIAKTLDFLGIYGVVDSYKGNKVVVYIDVSIKEQKQTKSVTSQPIQQLPIPQTEPLKLLPKEIKKINHDKIVADVNGSTKQIKQIKLDKIVVDANSSKKQIVKSTITHNYLKNDFVSKFISATPTNYTINLLNGSSYEKTLLLLKHTNILDNSFLFSYGENLIQYKVMFGIYGDMESANEALKNLPPVFLKFNPRVEMVSIKQNLFNKYHKNNNQTPKGTL